MNYRSPLENLWAAESRVKCEISIFIKHSCHTDTGVQLLGLSNQCIGSEKINAWTKGTMWRGASTKLSKDTWSVCRHPVVTFTWIELTEREPWRTFWRKPRPCLLSPKTCALDANGWEERSGRTWRSRGRGNCNQGVLYEKKTTFNERKN